MNHTIKKLPKNTVEINVVVPKSEIEKNYTASFEALLKELTIEGYRKGKAPKAAAEKHLPKERVYDHMVKTILPGIYEEVVKAENLKPVVSPHVELVKAKEGEDWEFKMIVAERPAVEMGDYKKSIKEAKTKNKKAAIWVPGQEPEQKEKKEDDQQQNMNIALTTILKDSKVEISDLIIEEELNHRLTRLLDDVQKLGLSAEAYLKSKGMTMEEMKEKIKKEIEETYKLEFILAEVAEKENITVEQKELDELFARIKNEAERKAAQDNAYLYATIIRKQKTLEFLSNL